MFKGKQNKVIPQSLDDCVKSDRIIDNLWIWAKRVETLGFILFIVLISIGVILSVIGGLEAADIAKTNSEGTAAFFRTFIASILEFALYAFLEYCIYHVIALLIGSLASIVQNTKITADIAIFNAKHGSDVKKLDNFDNICEDEHSADQIEKTLMNKLRITEDMLTDEDKQKIDQLKSLYSQKNILEATYKKSLYDFLKSKSGDNEDKSDDQQ